MRTSNSRSSVLKRIALLVVALVAIYNSASALDQKKTTSSSAPAKPTQSAKQKPTKPPQKQQVQPQIRPTVGTPPTRPPVAPKPQIGSARPYLPHPGEQVQSLPSGGKVYRDLRSGRQVVTDSNGFPRRIEVPNGLAGRTVITRATHGEREVVTGHPGNRVVSYGPHRGFIERPLRPGYISRTYIYGGHSFAHVYREYHYRSLVYYRYVPGRVYAQGYYAWAKGHWGGPVPYHWYGLATPAPWFGFYAGYFRPYPAYDSANLWLTDYVISQDLQLAYQNSQAANGNLASAPPPQQFSADQPALSPELKQMIANEVTQQLSDEQEMSDLGNAQTQTQGPVGGDQPPPALKDSFFFVASNLDVAAGGQQCTLTPGDLIRRKNGEISADGSVPVEVVTSKNGDCAADASFSLDIATLQEMHNQFREQIDAGLQVLTEKSSGLPSGPASNPQTLAEGTAAAAPDAETQVTLQEISADKVEGQLSGASN